MNLSQAIEVFVGGLTATRSQTHPYVAQRVDGMRVLQDALGRKHERKIKVISQGKTPEQVVTAIKNTSIGWHFVCDIHTDYEGVIEPRQLYKALGYRALSTEWMFVHPLQNIPNHTSLPPVRLVTHQSELHSLPKYASQPLKLMPGSRLFLIWDEDRVYGFVRNIDVDENGWVSGLFVKPDVRGQGYGRALMSSLLQSDHATGLKTSVLLANSAGARLYPHLGYQQIAVLQMFCPKER